MDPLTAFTDISLEDEPVGIPTPIMEDPRASASATSTPRFVRWMIRLNLVEASAPAASWQTTFDRLQLAYEQYVAAHPFPQEEEEETVVAPVTTTAPAATETAAAATPDLDPLTAMVQATESEAQRLAAMDLAYRKERALRNRGQGTARMLPESEDYDEAAAALIVLDKDLDRLADPHTTAAAGGVTTTTTVTGARKDMLRQVLFVIHCEYPEPGYRQGMHEIASYLLYALELDGARGFVEASQYQPALTYHVLAKVLRGMRAAFDVQSASHPTSTGPSTTLAQIGRRVDHFVRTHDPLLGQRLASLQVPPQMYFLKWIRLLFSREVPGVLDFWDQAFFESPTPTETLQWIPLLEALTAARLLVWSAHLMSLPDEGQLLQSTYITSKKLCILSCQHCSVPHLLFATHSLDEFTGGAGNENLVWRRPRFVADTGCAASHSTGESAVPTTHSWCCNQATAGGLESFACPFGFLVAHTRASEKLSGGCGKWRSTLGRLDG
jgi:ribosomal protein L31